VIWWSIKYKNSCSRWITLFTITRKVVKMSKEKHMKIVKKEVKKPEGTVPDIAYVIGLGIKVNTLIKSVAFKNGVGVLDYPGLAFASADWFDTIDGFLVQKKGFDIDFLADHFKNEHSAKVTKIKAKEATKLKNAIAAGKMIDKKYYKYDIEPEVKVIGSKKKSPDKVETMSKEVSSDDLTDGKEK
jgi:hypothetical protein